MSHNLTEDFDGPKTVTNDCDFFLETEVETVWFCTAALFENRTFDSLKATKTVLSQG